MTLIAKGRGEIGHNAKGPQTSHSCIGADIPILTGYTVDSCYPQPPYGVWERNVKINYRPSQSLRDFHQSEDVWQDPWQIEHLNEVASALFSGSALQSAFKCWSHPLNPCRSTSTKRNFSIFSPHFHGAHNACLRVMVLGTARTGKSYVIERMKN